MERSAQLHWSVTDHPTPSLRDRDPLPTKEPLKPTDGSPCRDGSRAAMTVTANYLADSVPSSCNVGLEKRFFFFHNVLRLDLQNRHCEFNVSPPVFKGKPQQNTRSESKYWTCLEEHYEANVP